VKAFQEGLHDLGYLEGQNLVIEYRWAGGDLDRLAPLAAELASVPVDVIVTSSNPAAQAAKEATSTIPVVMTISADPVGNGLIPSLARPEGNLTGLSLYLQGVEGKRLQLLQDALPGVSRVGVLGSTADSLRFGETEAAAQALGVEVITLHVRQFADFDEAFEQATLAQIDALFVLEQAPVQANRSRVLEFAVNRRLPGMYPGRDWAEAGGLMAYNGSTTAVYRRAAYYVDRILKGTKPADVPVEQPREFDVVINLKTAQALGLAIPQQVLLQATEVVQ
jgi:putative ABC transport system substrate-binding protein